MLIQFSLTNYRNFKDTATLDMSEAKITEFPEHLHLETDGLRLLPMIAMYGPNGCGKTNFLQGLWTLRQLILNAPQTADKPNHFFSHKEQLPVEYDILFRIRDREYEYQLKLTPTAVIEENLFGRNLKDSEFDVLFDRDNDGVFLCKKWQDIDVAALPDEYPLLYFLGTQTLDQELQRIIFYFKNMTFLNAKTDSLEALRDIISSEAEKKDLLTHVHNMGFDINDIAAENNSFRLTHLIQGKSLQLPWEYESFGVQKVLTLIAELIKARQENKLVLIDAPETGLHAKVLQYLYRFVGQNARVGSKSQVLFATQETSNMNNSNFRRDELWLIAKDEDGSSHLYTLALFLKENRDKVRKDEVYFKQYLEGRYGALPNTKL